jgi:hypothetical protein
MRTSPLVPLLPHPPSPSPFTERERGMNPIILGRGKEEGMYHMDREGEDGEGDNAPLEKRKDRGHKTSVTVAKGRLIC